MQMAMDKAVTEIVSPVIQRSVTIASRTTKELVLKVILFIYPSYQVHSSGFKLSS